MTLPASSNPNPTRASKSSALAAPPAITAMLSRLLACAVVPTPATLAPVGGCAGAQAPLCPRRLRLLTLHNAGDLRRSALKRAGYGGSAQHDRIEVTAQ